MPYPIPPVFDAPPPALPLAVVGDVHLCPEEPEVVEAFSAFLETRLGGGGTLLLLGDIFDLWVGKPQQADPIPARILAELKALEDDGVHVIFMQGNRDLGFHGVDLFDIEQWPQLVRATVGGRTVLFTHGDLLCTADHGYQRMRRFLKGPGGWVIENLFPYRVKRWLGEGTRRLSMRETGRKPRADMGIDYAHALRWLEHHDADVLVAGHVHTGVHHKFPGPPLREVVVLKDWERGGSVITLDGESVVQRAP